MSKKLYTKEDVFLSPEDASIKRKNSLSQRVTNKE